MKDYKTEIDKAIEEIRKSEDIHTADKEEIIAHLEAAKEKHDGIEKFMDNLRVKFEDIWEFIEPTVNELGLR